jgi:hypothetical protein
MSDYLLADRNIHQHARRFRVLLTRRPKNIYGGRFDTLEEARQVRDELERLHAPSRPGKPASGHRRTVKLLRAERQAAGQCVSCGECPPAPGLSSCRECLDILNFKRSEKRKEQATP